MDISRQREQALRIVFDKSSQSEYILIDYHLDTECRQLLGLPTRPAGSYPYTGWMVGNGETTKQSLVPSQKCIDLIKRWEGFRSRAYLCPAGVPTIGYGHTKRVKMGDTITHQKAEELLFEDVAIFANAVNRLVSVPLSQNQFDALTSFTYNLGIGAFGKSSLLLALNKKQYTVAASWFSRYVYAGKTRLPGLVRRREEEKRLFES
ncbi:MAG: lysozyme [Pleurocapsa sp.]